MRNTITINGKSMKVDEFEAMTELNVPGDLDLLMSTVRRLPDGLTVGGSLDLNPYPVTFPMPGVMKIGCECHTVEEWEGFSDSRISRMDRATARKFWGQWKAPLIAYARCVDARRPAKSEAAE